MNRKAEPTVSARNGNTGIPNSSREHIGLRLLFCEVGRRKPGHLVRAHTHTDIWHIDIHQGGTAFVEAGALRLEMTDRDVVIIPPGIHHGFKYGNNEASYISGKCAITGLSTGRGVRVLKSSSLLDPLREALRSYLPEPRGLTELEYEVLTSLYTAVIHIYRSDSRPRGRSAKSRRDAVVAKAVNFVDANSHLKLTVKDVAHDAAYSADYLTRHFKNTLGLSLKSYIDKRRAENVGRHLLFTNQSIKEIASALNFTDQYDLSRFFKRHYGKSPRQYRREKELAGPRR